MKVVYGVHWIESDFGQRDEGYALFMDKEVCIQETKAASKRGCYDDGGYCGPQRPLFYVEIPFDSLEDKLKESLQTNGKTHTDDHWYPQFKGEQGAIT